MKIVIFMPFFVQNLYAIFYFAKKVAALLGNTIV